MSDLKNKIVMLGDSGVGKTSLINQWVRGQFNDNQNPTIGAGYFEKTVEIENEPEKIQIWDTAGEERFKSMTPIYSQGSIGAIIVFDLTRKDTMDHIPDWVKCLQDTNIPIVIAANKSDLEESRQVTNDKLLEYTNGLGYQCFETCANNGSGVDELFIQTINLALEYKKNLRTSKKEDNVDIDASSQNQNQTQNGRSCC